MKFSFEDLEVWKIAVDFTEKIYSFCRDFPDNEIYGITSQLKRASLSIALNIAEGKGRYSKKEFLQFLYHARGSLYETITIMKMSLNLKYLTRRQYDELIADCEKIQSKISGLINYLKTP